MLKYFPFPPFINNNLLAEMVGGQLNTLTLLACIFSGNMYSFPDLQPKCALLLHSFYPICLANIYVINKCTSFLAYVGHLTCHSPVRAQ